MVVWDPKQYGQFEAQRSRPFRDLLAQVAGDVATFIDVGCGPTKKTQLLLARWPKSRGVGIDSSPEMLAAAPKRERLKLVCGDVRDYAPAEQVDLVFSNAALHWVPNHPELLAELARWVKPGGALAAQMPANFEQPTHRVPAEVAEASFPAAKEPAGRTWPVLSAPAYGRILLGLGMEVNAWETTYVHPLPDSDGVYEWIAGSVLRPYFDCLSEQELPAFERAVRQGLRAAYSEAPALLTYRRVFFVARWPEAAA